MRLSLISLRVASLNYNTSIRVPIRYFQFGLKTMSTSTVTSLPSQPKAVFNEFGKKLQESLVKEYSHILDDIIQGDQKKDSLFSLSRESLKLTGKAMFDMRTGEAGRDINQLASSGKLVEQIVQIMGGNEQPRDNRFTFTIERYAEAKMFHYFFTYGVLAPPSVMAPCNDEEYIGAALGFAQELSRYVVGRASENDVASIRICRTLIDQLNGMMLEFDFRNGHLRRKYDGLKYTLKTTEEILFELSLVNRDASASKDAESLSDDSMVPLKRLRVEADDSERVNVMEIKGIKERMDTYDKEREKVIKLCRDVQKLSKQSIYSVHRGSYADAQQKADSAKALILQIFNQSICNHPSLRMGSFASCVEEWVECLLLLEWASKQRIALKSELGDFVTVSEYIGALSDFTGEIGRMAVNFAAQRNVSEVKAILQADLIISSYMSQFNVSGTYSKKLGQVNTNFKKVEDILYELTLQKMGGKALRRDPEVVAEDEKHFEE